MHRESITAAHKLFSWIQKGISETDNKLTMTSCETGGGPNGKKYAIALPRHGRRERFEDHGYAYGSPGRKQKYRRDSSVTGSLIYK